MDLYEYGCEHHAQREDVETFDCLNEIKKLVQAILALPPLEEMRMAFAGKKFHPRRNFNLQRHVEEIDSSTLPEVLSLAKRGKLKDLKKLIDKDGAKGAWVQTTDGQTMLHLAARGGHLEICEFLIFGLQFDVNIKDCMGRTPLHEAASGNHLEALSRLIDHGADVNAQASMGLTALHFAAEAGSVRVVTYLISLGLDLNAKSDYGTPLWIAAIQNHKEVMQALLTSQANPNIFPDGMLSPLHASILTRSHESVTKLLSAGADPNIKVCRVSPLEAAIKCGDKRIVELLLNAGARANVMDDQGLTPLEFAMVEKNHEMVRILFRVASHISTIRDWNIAGVITHCASEEVVKRIRMKADKVYSLYGLVGQKAYDAGKYHTSFVWWTKEAAARLEEIQNYNDSKMELPFYVEMKMLIQAKMAVLRSSNLNPERLDSSTTEDIFIAARCGDIAKLSLLISKFGSERRNLLSNLKAKHGDTILHLAAGNGQTQICKYLIMELKFDINIKDAEGYTPLHAAAIHDRTETLSYLIDAGADVNAVDLSGKTVLQVAAEIGSLDAMCLLISNGFDVNAHAGFGTPLCSAALQSSGESMQFLLSRGAKPNEIPEGMYPPLHLAIIWQSYKCAELLLSAKADPNMKSFGASPLQIAIKNRDLKAFELLLKGGADPNEKVEYGLTPLELAVLEKNKGMVKKLFPRTAPIPYIEDWSVGGVMKHYRCKEVKKQIRMKALKAYSLYNEKGQNAYKAGRYLTANYWFARAIETYQGDRANVYLKKSLCWVHMNDPGIAMEEALACEWILRKSKSVEGACLFALNEILCGDFEWAIGYIEASFEKKEASPSLGHCKKFSST